MSTVTFDTLEFTHKLREAGFDERQAEAVVRVVASSQGDLLTEKYFEKYFDLKMEKELSPIRADLLVVKWMMGVLIAVALANFAKQFF